MSSLFHSIGAAVLNDLLLCAYYVIQFDVYDVVSALLDLNMTFLLLRGCQYLYEDTIL